MKQVVVLLNRLVLIDLRWLDGEPLFILLDAYHLMTFG